MKSYGLFLAIAVSEPFVNTRASQMFDSPLLRAAQGLRWTQGGPLEFLNHCFVFTCGQLDEPAFGGVLHAIVQGRR